MNHKKKIIKWVGLDDEKEVIVRYKINEGDIFVTSFGYDAHLSTFYKVISKTEKRVSLIKLGTIHLPGGTFASYQVLPGEPITMLRGRKPTISGSIIDSDTLKIDGELGDRWNGKPIENYNHH